MMYDIVIKQIFQVPTGTVKISGNRLVLWRSQQQPSGPGREGTADEWALETLVSPQPLNSDKYTVFLFNVIVW